MEALSAGPPFPAADPWTAASEGAVRFEPEAIRQVIRDHTDEAGVTQLTAKLAMLCRQAMKRRPPGDNAGPEVITPDVVRDVLGEGTIDALPAAVCAAIARERQRVADKSDGDAKPTNNWIEWLEQTAMDPPQHGADLNACIKARLFCGRDHLLRLRLYCTQSQGKGR